LTRQGKQGNAIFPPFSSVDIGHSDSSLSGKPLCDDTLGIVNTVMEAKEAFAATLGAVGDTTTLATQFSSLSVSEESSSVAGEHGPAASLYQAFILAGFGHG
jgi:hypothetical protein